jgi:hypothetical protein
MSRDGPRVRTGVRQLSPDAEMSCFAPSVAMGPDRLMHRSKRVFSLEDFVGEGD